MLRVTPHMAAPCPHSDLAGCTPPVQGSYINYPPDSCFSASILRHWTSADRQSAIRNPHSEWVGGHGPPYDSLWIKSKSSVPF